MISSSEESDDYEMEKNAKNISGKLTKIFSFLITLTILALLLFSAPASAYLMNLGLSQNTATQGDSVVFTAGIHINTGERVAIDKLVLELSGPSHSVCTFYPNGTIINGCSGMSIVKINTGDDSTFGTDTNTTTITSQYGYGYGYGYGYTTKTNSGYGAGDLNYRITLDTTNYLSGIYATTLYSYVGSNINFKSGDNLRINSAPDFGGSIYTGNNSISGVHHQSPDVVSLDTICLNAWQCTDWTACDGGYQTRSCGQTRSDCVLTPKPDELRECAITLKPYEKNSNIYDSINLPNTTTSEVTTTQNLGANSTSGITGAFIGVMDSSKSFAVIILLAVLIGLVLGLIIVKIFSRRKIVQRRRLMYQRPKIQ